MKNRRKILVILMTLSTVCLFSGWDRDETKEEKLQYLQFNSTRMDVKKYPTHAFQILGRPGEYDSRRE